MSIAIEKGLPASERFALCRFYPARWLTLANAGANLWQTDCTFLVDEIKSNGVALTKDAAAPVANLHWYQDPATFQITIYYTSTPSETNDFIAYHYLYYTGEMFRSITSDPEDALTSVVDWNPRIIEYPSFFQSFTDIFSGVFSISDTTVTIANGDADFQKYLTADDTFYQTSVDIWLCIGDETNIQKIFSGTVTGISMSQNTVTIRIADGFKQLQKPAFMGDTEGECIFRRESGSFASLDPNKSGTTCPYIIGSSSRYKTYASLDTIAGTPAYKVLQDLNEAVCTDYTDIISTSTNRTWGFCRMSGTVPTQTLGTPVRSLSSGDYVFLYFTGMSNVTVGDTIQWNDGSDWAAPIRHVGSFAYGGNAYNLIVGVIPAGSTLSHLNTFTNSKSVGLLYIRSDGLFLEPSYGRDYTVSSSVTSGGHNFVYLTFLNNFEANNGGQALDPGQDNIYYRVSNTAAEKHGEALSDILEAAGLTVDAATFTAADGALNVKARFQIPNFDEIDYDTYLFYAQSILKSTLGYLRLSGTGAVQYNLVEAVASGGVRDNNLMLDQSTSLEIEYQDIATKIIFYNPHYEGQEAIDLGLASVTVESVKARKLNQLENVNRYRHVLEDISTRSVDITGLLSSRRALYRLTTATEDIDTNLGDNLTVSNKIVLGDTSSVDVTVVSVDKSPRNTTIEALDLEGL